MKFFAELWVEYRELAKSVVGVFCELVVLLVLVKVGALLIHWFGVPKSCTQVALTQNWDETTLIDCTHTVVLLLAWAGLLVSFVAVAAVFTYKHTIRRIHDVDVAEQMQQVTAYSSGIAAAIASLEPDAGDGDRMRAIQLLLDLRPKHGLDRKVAIFLGRLYKARKDYEAAVSAASFFVSAKQNARQTMDIDYADVLYNRACYRSLLAAQLAEPQPQAAELAKRGALEDLRASIAIAPANAGDARSDIDFEPLRADPAFTQLIGPGDPGQ